MANVHHFKIENAGNNARIGNVDIRLSLDKQNSTKSNYTEEHCRNYDTIDKNNPRPLHHVDEYEGDTSSESAKQDETESESETDTDNQYTHLRKNLEDALCYTENLLNMTSTRKGTKGYKDLKKGMKRERVHKNFLQSKLTEYFKKDKLRKTLTSVIKGSSDLMVYGLGSYFDEEHSVSARQLNNPNYRYSTFLNYAGSGSRESLARDGFYHNYEEGSTSTKCFVCGFTNTTWGPNDDVSFVHRQMSPNCTFINRSSATTEQHVAAMESVTLRTNITDAQTGNMTRTGSAAVNEAVRCIDLARTHRESRRHGEHLIETGGVQTNHRRFGTSSQNGASSLPIEERDSRQETKLTSSQCVTSHSSIGPVVNTEQTPSRNMALNLGMSRNNPKHPEYANFEARLRSYANWPKTALPNQLAEAGFFYAGFEDCVRCFNCDGGLRNWETGDMPMEKHSACFPHCEFIQRARRQMNNTLENRDEQQVRRNTERRGHTDPLVTSMVKTMTEMGFTEESALEAAGAAKVNNQTDQLQVLLNEAITWALEHQRNDTRDVEAQQQTEDSLDSPDAVAGAIASSSSSYTREMASLKAENQRLLEMNKCKMCMVEKIAIVFLPCGHQVCCDACATYMHNCPSCKAVITGKIKTVLPL